MNAVSDSQGAPTFGAQLRSARLDAGIRHAIDLASVLSVSEQTVNRWERGERRPQRSLRPELAAALHLSIEQLDGMLGTRTSRSATRRNPSRSNVVVSLRQQNSANPSMTEQPLPGADAEDAGPATVFENEDLNRLREEFVRAVITGGLQTGYAQDSNWHRAAQQTARMLGLPWDGPRP